MVCDRNHVAIQKAQDLAQAHNIRAIPYKVDGRETPLWLEDNMLIIISVVSDAQQVQDTIAKAAEDFGKIDVFIANAGTYYQHHPV
jgi:NAD(P)-dependent dehydrogenase (short-subunit alcohol dehydrogenase family)